MSADGQRFLVDAPGWYHDGDRSDERDAAGRKVPHDIPDSAFEIGLDTLILGALRWEEHPTHFTVAEALEVAWQRWPVDGVPSGFTT